MKFKIICAGSAVPPKWIQQTFASIELQTCTDWEVIIAYEGGDLGTEFIEKWCGEHDSRWIPMLHREQFSFSVKNRHEAVFHTASKDDDIIIYLDIDGDRFAHHDVLLRLVNHYQDMKIALTYGSYVSEPFDQGCVPAHEFPPGVIANQQVRDFIRGGNWPINHLRTMKFGLYRQIPIAQFQWAAGPQVGMWYRDAVDYHTMISAIELAGEDRVKFIPETLMIYNSINPNAAWRVIPASCNECSGDFLVRPPLERLKIL